MVPGEFGSLLRDRRLAAGLTQEELADRSGVSVRTIGSAERGLSQPYLKTVSVLADALGLAGDDRDQFLQAARPLSGPETATETEPLTTPRQLPARPTDFTGRSAELKSLAGLLDAEGGSLEDGPVVLEDGPVVLVIDGTAGVGKTALAVDWAHQLADRFPDGQLYVNLRGYDPDQPMPVADTLAGFLRALGVPGPEIPPDTEERAARYRSLLAGRRMLVVLDNAGTVEQARALLPGSRSCVTVITSRDALAGLVARDGARRLDLDLLPADEAGILLTRLIGDRARAQPEAIAALATACARLPLALRVAAELVATRPSTPVADLVTELADEQQRLDLLEAGGDPRTAVRAVFSWSFRHLDPATGNAFRLLGVHPGPDLEPHAIAALTGGTLAQTRRQLDQLARAHLISATATGRYSLHDLLGTYARELATDHDGPDAIHIALTRLLDHYLHTAATAMDALYPGEANRHRRPRVPAPAIPAPAIPGPAVTDQATARAWLDAERATLVAVTAYSAAHGWPGHATRLAATLHDYLDIAGHLPEAITIHDSAYRAARAAGDRAAEALALSDICSIYQRQGRYQQVIDQLPRALELYREIGDLKGEARVMCNLGLVESQSGRYEQAIDYYRRAIAAYRQLGQPGHGARTLNNLGFVERNIGLYDEAADHLEQAVELGHEFGDETAAAHALINLGITRVSQRRYGQAMAHLQQALELTRQAGYRAGEAFALSSMAAVDRRQGRYEQAGERGRKALALSRRIGDQACEADALNGLAELSFATGQHARARTEYAEAIKIARRNGDNHELARSLDGLGQACLALGDPGLARQHWEEALVLYTSLGWPEADQIRARLAAAPA